MAVNLSPVGGAAAQFFTNTGAVLTGGKLYTYLAGTTTPAATYTTNTGATARTNPIVLDSAGRVPGSGEIWLTVGISYKFLLKDSNDVLIGTYDNIPSQISTDASLVTYTPAGAGAVTTTVQAKLRQYVSVKDFGAVGDGTTDDTVALNAALQSPNIVLLPQGTYRITSQLVFGLYCCGLVGEGMYTSVISKQFNGNAILCDANGAVMQNFGVVGNGATYSDGGIVPRGYNISIQNCRITDTADSCIKVAGAVGSNALAATYLSVDNCFLNPTNAATTYSIRSITPDDSGRPTDRSFNNLNGGSSLIDFSGMNYATLSNSLGTIVKFDSNCSKICINNCRFTNAAANIVIYGNDHVIENNLWTFGAGYGISTDSTAASVYFGPTNNITIGTSSFSSIADGSALNGGNFNNLTTQLKTFVFGWYASGTNPTLGDATTTAYYKQEGRLCWAQFTLTRGATGSIGSGTYSFQLPWKSYVDAVGTVVVKSSSGVYYSGTLAVGGSSSVATVYFTGASAAWVASDFAFGSSASVQATITYLISPT
jgi:hypothetical protein